MGGFVKSNVMGRGSSAKSLLILTRVGGWSEKGQKHPYVISEQSLRKTCVMFQKIFIQKMGKFFTQVIIIYLVLNSTFSNRLHFLGDSWCFPLLLVYVR